VFWDYYKMVEEGTKVSLEDFATNSDLKNKVKDGVKGLFQCFLKEASWQGGNVEDLIWSFGKQGIFPPYLVQELEDLYNLVFKDVDKTDDRLLYGMLVRIMEDIEEAINYIRERKRS